MGNPYDDVVYRCSPIEWTAPERLSLSSMLHGGPRAPSNRCDVLELGCGDGGNLLPMAFHRPRSTFVGVDGAASQVGVARDTAARLGIRNVRFIHADFRQASDRIEGRFDYVIGHGVFSWIDDEARDRLLDIAQRCLRENGLLYLNYNTLPGWAVRGLVREFLLAQTAGHGGLRERAELARRAAACIAAASGVADDAAAPYARLIADEFRFLLSHDVSYIAHEYLSEHNRAYWRSEFLSMLRSRDFHAVGDADFNHASGRVRPGLDDELRHAGLVGRSIEDTVDLLLHRQLHSPILSFGAFEPVPLTLAECEALEMASCLAPTGQRTAAGSALFEHPTTRVQVETSGPAMEPALRRLQAGWPDGAPVADLFDDVAGAMEDLLLLHRNGLVDLRLPAFNEAVAASQPLACWEAGRGYATTRHHLRMDHAT